MASKKKTGGYTAATLERQIESVGRLAVSTVSVDHGLAAALREISEVTADALSIDRISIWRHSEGDTMATSIEVFDARSRSHETGHQMEVNDSQSHMVELWRSHVLAIDDTDDEPRIDSIRESNIRPLNIRAIMFVSIRREGRFVGSMIFSKFAQPHVWTAEEQAFAGVYAEFVSRNLETQERRRLESAFEDYVVSASDWLWEWDAEHQFTYLSERYYEVSGDVPENVIGKSRSDIGRVIDDPLAAALYERAIKNHQPFRDIVAKRNMPSGKRQWIRSSAVSFHDDQGQFAGYRGVSTDVTESVLMEQAMQADELQFRDLIDAAPVPLTIIIDGQYVYGNTLAYEFFGVTEDEFIGMPARSLYVD
ncbi:MAG: PAS domain S-box protein [Alphaproteobacteria bacterium]